MSSRFRAGPLVAHSGADLERPILYHLGSPNRDSHNESVTPLYCYYTNEMNSWHGGKGRFPDAYFSDGKEDAMSEIPGHLGSRRATIDSPGHPLAPS